MSIKRFASKGLYVVLIFYFVIFLNTLYVHAGDLTLTWDAPTEYTDGTALTDFAGYPLYYKVESGDYDHSIYIGDIAS